MVLVAWGWLEHHLVFLVLMVRPKLLQAAEKLSISACISCSSLALRAQSSAKRKSLRTVSFRFVAASSLLGLNSFPSVLNVMLTPGLLSLKASVSIAESIRLNSVGAKTQLCLTLLATGKASEGSPSSRTQAIRPSRNGRTTAMNVLGQPNFPMIFQSLCGLTVSKALVRSAKVV